MQLRLFVDKVQPYQRMLAKKYLIYSWGDTGNEELPEYYALASSVDVLTEQLHSVVMASSNAKSALIPGRMVLLKGLHGVAEAALVCATSLPNLGFRVQYRSHGCQAAV